MPILKKVMLLTFILFVILSTTTTIRAENYTSNNYTSLGDSIAYGMSSSRGNGYVDLFYNYLKGLSGNSKMNKYNFGTPEDTTSDLLSKLKNDADIQKAVKKAKIITICAGGNNILLPIISAACEEFQLNPNSETLVKDLYDKIKAAPDIDSIVQALMNSQELQSDLISGVFKFYSDWPQIIKAVKTLSPKANIYAMTIYNPVNTADPLYSAYEQILQQMNAIISLSAKNNNYHVVDVYSAFKAYNGEEPLVNFNLAIGRADPHPTNKGHAVISQLYLSLAKSLEASATATMINKDASITSSKYKVDKANLSISIKQKQVPLNIFKSNIKIPKGASFIVLKADGKIALIRDNIVPGMKVKVTAKDKKTFKLYRILK